MAQGFKPSANSIAKLFLLSLVFVPLALIGVGLALARSTYVTGENRTVEQPNPFSHAHHSAEIGIDCRYCHTGVEDSATAGLPPTTTCMTCHSQLWTDAAMLAPVRESLVTGVRLKWAPVNDLPDYVYFNHSVHVTNGIACTSCHGSVGEIRLTRQTAPLTMDWCLDCHRDPVPHLQPPDRITSPFRTMAPMSGIGQASLEKFYDIHTEGLTDCSTCHR